jgi:hypothetical protein
MNGIERQGMARASEIYFKYVSPFSLAAIVMLNFLLIYLNLVNLENQSTILHRLELNQEIGLNISNQNQDLLNHIIELQVRDNETFFKVLEIAANRSTNNNT